MEKKNLVGEYENKVTFTNTHKGGVVPTGILMNNLPFILLVAVAIVAFVSLAVKKDAEHPENSEKRKENNSDCR